MNAVLRGKLIALSASKKKLESAYTSSWTAHLKALKQNEPYKPKRSRRQEVIKLRANINEVETNRTIQRMNNTRTWLLEKIKKIDKPLARLTKRHRDSIQINQIRNEGVGNNRNWGNSKYHQNLQQNPIFNKIRKSGWNGSFSRQILGNKVKSGSDKSSKSAHNP